jgi:hypothetical protein
MLSLCYFWAESLRVVWQSLTQTTSHQKYGNCWDLWSDIPDVHKWNVYYKKLSYWFPLNALHWLHEKNCYKKQDCNTKGITGYSENAETIRYYFG